MIENAPHPCYLKEPALFNSMLLQFANGHQAGTIGDASTRLKPDMVADWSNVPPRNDPSELRSL